MPSVSERAHPTEDRKTNLGGPDILSRSPDPARLDAALGVDASIPGRLDIVLDLKDGRDVAVDVVVSLKPDADDVRTYHLNVAVPTETTWGQL